MRSSLVTINSLLRKIVLIISIFFYATFSASVLASNSSKMKLIVVFEKGCLASQGSDAASHLVDEFCCS